MQEVSQVLEISIMYTYIKWACIDFGPLMFVFVKQKYSLCYTTTLYTAHFPILRTSVGWCTLYSTHRVYNVHTFSNNLNRMGKHATKTAAEKKNQVTIRTKQLYLMSISHLTHSHTYTPSPEPTSNR